MATWGCKLFSIGDTVTVDTAQGTAHLRVVGLARTPGQNPAASGIGEGYMSDAASPGIWHSLAGTRLGQWASVLQIAVKVQNQSPTPSRWPYSRCCSRMGSPCYGNAVSTGGHTSPRTNAIAGVFSLLRILAIVAVVMSGFLILNTVTTLVAEQTAIIGTMKAAGGTRGAILRGYLVSVGIYSLLATLPAIVLGLLGGYALGSFLACERRRSMSVPLWCSGGSSSWASPSALACRCSRRCCRCGTARASACARPSPPMA